MELLSLISPLIKAPKDIPSHMKDLTFFHSSTTKKNIWEVLIQPNLYKQIKKACLYELRKSPIKELDDLIIDTCISRIEYILKHDGLPFPNSGLDRTYRWEGWFVLMFKNASKTALDKERKAIEHESVEALEEKGKRIHKDDIAPSPEDTLLLKANTEISNHLSLHTYLLHGDLIKPQMRLYTLLLNDPASVQYKHFQECSSPTKSRSNPFYRSLSGIWKIWPQSCDLLLSIRKKNEDNKVQTKARNEIIYLLFGNGYSDSTSFMHGQEKTFKNLKDRVRKTINRCTYLLHKARIAYILEHIDITKEPTLYRDLLHYDLHNGMILTRENMDQIDIFVQALLLLSGENYSRRKVGAIIHLEHMTLDARLKSASNAGERIAGNLSADFKKSRKKL